MNALLQNVCDQALADLEAQFKEASDELLASIHKAETEAQLQEAPMKFNIGFKIQLDLDKSTITNTLSWSVKHSLETSHQIEDPNQPKLDGIDSVTISTDNSSVTMTGKEFSKLAGKVGR